MRGAWIIGLVIVLLIIGILVMKNMGNDNQRAVKQIQTEKYTQRAKSAADEANAKIKAINEQTSASE